MNDNLEFHRQKHGGNWPQLVRDMRSSIYQRMRDRRTKSFARISDIIEIEMKADGRDPRFLMAVCAEMEEESKTAEAAR